MISPCPSVKYLGVVISSNLSWSSHIQKTVKKKLNSTSALSTAALTFGDPSSTVPYCCTIEYCGALWDPHCQTDIQALEKVQKYAARITICKWDQDYSSLLTSLQWQPLSTRRRIQKLKLCYKILNNLSIIPADCFTKHPKPLPRHPHSCMLSRPLVRMNYHKFSIL